MKLKWTLKNNHSGAVLNLSTDPKGWQDIQLVHNRDEKWRGVFYEYALEVGFYCKGGGKEFVDAEYDDYGSEGNIDVTIQVFCDSNWTTLFVGQIDFSTYRQEFKGKKLYTFCNLQKKGITQVIRNREDIEVNLLSDTSLGGTSLLPYIYAPYDLTLHSKIIHLESEWEIEDHNCCFRFDTTGPKELYIIPNTNLTLGDFKDSNETQSRCEFDAVFNGFLEDAQHIVNLNNNQLFITQNTVTLDWTISGSMTFYTYDVSIPDPDACADSTCGTNSAATKIISSVQPRLRVFWGNDANGNAQEGCQAPIVNNGDIFYTDLIGSNEIHPFVVAPGVPKFFSLTLTRDIIINPGDKIWFYWVIDMNFDSGSGDVIIEFNYNPSTLNISSDTISDASTTKAIPIHEAWSRLCESLTDQTFAFKSDFFGRTNSQGLSYGTNGCGAFTALSSGSNIRNLDFIEQPITSNLSDMFNSCNSVWGIGLGVETIGGVEVVVVEEVDYFYDNTVIFSAINAPNVQMSFAEDQCFNEVHLGYAKWETEETNGIDEPNTRATWTFPGIKQIKKSFEAICKFIASMYSIELTRRHIPKQTEDFKYDNDIFLFALTRDVNSLDTCEKDENFASISDIIDSTTAYNLRFNLLSNFKRVMNQFTTGLTKQQPQTIKYTSYEGNKDMTFAFTPDGCVGDHLGFTVSNVQNVIYPDSASRRPDPVVLPEKYSFSYPVPFQNYLTIKANPKGVIEFTHKGEIKKGHILKLTYNLKSSIADFELIRKFA